jgi:hypothetical protein
MIVFIAGMQRSGSTFTFNVARELLERQGSVHADDFGAIADIHEIIKRSNDSAHIIIKGHKADEFFVSLIRHRAIPVICSVRRIEETAASWIDTFGFDFKTTVDHLKQWFLMFEKIRPVALILPYSLIDRSPRDAARRISDTISPSASESELTSLADKYSKENVQKFTNSISKSDPDTRDIGFSFLNVKTLFHRRHVSSLTPRQPENHLSRTQLEHLRKEFACEIALLEPLLDASRAIRNVQVAG